MVDRIELILLHQSKQVGKFHSDEPGRFYEHLEPTDEIIQVRHVGQHVVADNKIGRPSVGAEIDCRLFAKEGNLSAAIATLSFKRLSTPDRVKGLPQALGKSGLVGV